MHLFIPTRFSTSKRKTTDIFNAAAYRRSHRTASRTQVDSPPFEFVTSVNVGSTPGCAHRTRSYCCTQKSPGLPNVARTLFRYKTRIHSQQQAVFDTCSVSEKRPVALLQLLRYFTISWKTVVCCIDPEVAVTPIVVEGEIKSPPHPLSVVITRMHTTSNSNR